MDESDFPTVIGPDAKFKGELNFEKGVRILGGFEGRITTSGNLVVAPEGVIQADIEAGTITVEGEISGNVAAQDIVELKNTARLQGDLRCERLVVVDGARFVGHCNVGNGTADKTAPAKKSARPTTSVPSQAAVSEDLGNIESAGRTPANKNIDVKLTEE